MADDLEARDAAAKVAARDLNQRLDRVDARLQELDRNVRITMLLATLIVAVPILILIVGLVT